MSTTWINRGHLYAPHVTPVMVDCNFIVDADNVNGLGIRSLKGQGVQNVFMHTSATPGRGPNGKLNPNPAVGIIMVQLSDNFTRLYDVMPMIQSPNNGSAVTSTVINLTYTITALGTATLAQWRAKGVPPGVTPALGVTFVATASGAIGGSAAVQQPLATGSGIVTIELIGNTTLSLAPVPVGGSPNVGGYVYLQCLAATDATTTTLVKTAPAEESVISLVMYMNQSSVTVAGE